jgi:hypothetical protein
VAFGSFFAAGAFFTGFSAAAFVAAGAFFSGLLSSSFFRVTIAGVLLTHSLAPLAGNTLRFGNARKHALKKLGCRGFSLYSDGHPRNLVVALRRLWR